MHFETGNLELRQTHTYVGTYQHLDDWDAIGRYAIEASTTVCHNDEPDCEEQDHCDPRTTTMLVSVSDLEPDVDTDQIGRALRDSFTSHDCAHDWDCCGCRSYYASAQHIGGQHWKVEITSSRNY